MTPRHLLPPLMLLLAGMPAGVAPADDGSESWGRIERAIQDRRQQDVDLGNIDERRRMWRYLHDYLHAEFERGSAASRRRLVAAWSGVADPACVPLPLPPRTLSAIRPGWRGQGGEYRLWLVPLTGQVVLFAYPRASLDAPAHLHSVHRTEVAAQPGDESATAKLKHQLACEMNWMGPERWALILQQTPSRQQWQGIPTLQDADGKYAVVAEGRQFSVSLPGDDHLGSWIGKPYDPLVASPPGGLPVFLAIDWSDYFASDKLRGWLLAEVLHLASAECEHWFVGRQVFLMTPGQAFGCPLQALRREGTWPAGAPAGHAKDTVGALAQALSAAEPRGPLRLVFVTWNSELTVPEEIGVANRRMSGALTHDPQAVARQVNLQIMQVHGRRQPLFERLAGPRNYGRWDYEPESAPSLLLPVLEP